MMNMDNILKKLKDNLAIEVEKAKEKYNEKTSEELLEIELKNRTFFGNDVFIKMNKLYSEVNFKKFSLSMILSYMFGYSDLVYIPEKEKLYESFRPDQIKRMLIGSEVHNAIEKYASSLADFEIEKKMDYNSDGDIITGKLDLALNRNGTTYIIDLKTGKIDENYVKYQIGAYAYLYSMYNDNVIDIIGFAINPENIYKIELPRSKINDIIYDIIKTKDEIKKDLEAKKVYYFNRQKIL